MSTVEKRNMKGMEMDTNEIQDELESIARKHRGLLRPVDVVEFAQDTDTVLHSEFEWDDSVAAHEHRLEQARRVIRMYVTVVEQTNTPMRVYVSLPSDRAEPGGGYRTLVSVMSDIDQCAELLATALAELNAVKRKYQNLRELAPIFSALDKVVKRAEKAVTKAASRALVPARV